MKTTPEFWVRISWDGESGGIKLIGFGKAKFREVRLRAKKYQDGNPSVLINLKGGNSEFHNYRGWLKTLKLDPEREKEFTDLIYTRIVEEFTKKGYMKS